MAGAQRFPCPICIQTFTTSPDLRKHQSSKKHFSQTLSRGVGLERLTTEESLNQHQNNSQVYSVCANCYYHCKTKDELKQHLASTDHSPRYRCDPCNKTYLKGELLVKHLRSKSHRTKIRELENPQLVVKFSACANCDYQCKNRTALKQHLDSQGHTAKFECRTCVRVCLHKGDYFRHMKSEEHEIRKALGPNCANCSQRFTQQSPFEAHLISSGHVARYRCDLCDKVFIRQDVLQQHISGKKHQRKIKTSSVCEDCDFWCDNELALRRHLESTAHYGKFECEKCLKVFVDEESHATHLESEMHIRREAEGSSCYDCDRGFLSQEDFLRHLDFFGHVPNYRCDPCDEIFMLETALEEHRAGYEHLRKTTGRNFEYRIL